jgi:hypothetical protein
VYIAMRRKWYVVPALLLAATAVSLARAQTSTLTKATLFTQTTHEDKDEEVCVNVEVKTASGAMIAHAYRQDCSHSDRTEYREGSRHQFDLIIDSSGLARDAAKGFKVVMWKQRGYGHDDHYDDDDHDDHDDRNAWAFDVRVSLSFSNGEPLSASKDNVVLVSRRGDQKPSVGFANGDK